MAQSQAPLGAQNELGNALHDPHDPPHPSLPHTLPSQAVKVHVAPTHDWPQAHAQSVAHDSQVSSASHVPSPHQGT